MKILSGKQKRNKLLMVYGESGIGKSSFAAEFPSPLFLCTEDGLGDIDVPHVLINSYDEFWEALDSDLIKNYKTLVIDSVDHLEGMIFNWMMRKYKVDVVAKVAGGYGAYVGIALTEWQKVMAKVRELRENLDIVLISHNQVKKFEDPTLLEPYDKYTLKLQDKAAAYLTETVDILMFCKFETFVKKVEGLNKNKAVGTQKRLCHVYPHAAYDAKTRFKMPEVFELGYKHFIKALGEPSEDLTVLNNYLLDNIRLITEDELRDKAIKAFNIATGYEQLLKMKKRVDEILNSQGE